MAWLNEAGQCCSKQVSDYSQCQTTSIVIISNASKSNHLIPMSVQESPKIQVCLPIGTKNYCAMPCNEQDLNLYQICQGLTFLQENVLPSSLIHDVHQLFSSFILCPSSICQAMES